MKYERISIMVAIMWEIFALLISAVVIILILVIFAPHTWLWYTLLWVSGALTVLATFIYVPFLYLNCEYGINHEAVIYKKGVFFRTTQMLYRERIVFVTVYDNPFTSLLHVSSLVISAAGGSMTILFMNEKRAKELASLLSGENISTD